MRKRACVIGCLLSLSALLVSTPAQTVSWTDISSNFLYGPPVGDSTVGVGGVCTNRLTGEMYMSVNLNGLFYSFNQGTTYTQVAKGIVGGQCASEWSMQVDQNHPQRVAVFSVYGNGACTMDGATWTKINYTGDGWTFGSVDWTVDNPKVMLALQFGTNNVYKSTDLGAHWTKLSITIQNTSFLNTDACMIGVMDSTTFVYSANAGSQNHTAPNTGISRSTDGGATWTHVSDAHVLSHVPVYFKGTYYIGTANGIFVSKDKGATWQAQGTPPDANNVEGDIIDYEHQGPFFGADENTMVLVTENGPFRSFNAGTSWTKIAGWAPNCNNTKGWYYDPGYSAPYAWDPIKDVVYAARAMCMCPLMKSSSLGHPTAVIAGKKTANTLNPVSGKNTIVFTTGSRASLAKFNSMDMYNVFGRKVQSFEQAGHGVLIAHSRQ
ncbi:MAG: sialidase family protein [Chitinivibrionales bacterium]|nr:sialidase family protein [Chitinivibrionales bacterium]